MMKTREHTSAVWMKAVLAPSSDEIKRAASVLDEGSKTTIVCGQGALDGGELIEEIAEKLAAPVMKALLGRAVVPDDSPFTSGGIDLLGTLSSELAMEECDSLLIIGSNMPYVNYYLKAGQARAVQTDSDPSHLGWCYEIEVGLVGDACVTLEALLPLIERKNDHLLCQ
jgi:thiamine pyrophosphate-dependent acetolactate synthase large subunit-like protein